jgi:2-hydroxy-3-keto-5-methylthiopentenyl-1-phosphate phosphatase
MEQLHGMKKAPGGHKRIVFCDFDGTITARESLEAVLRTFTPEAYNAMMDRLRAGEVTIRDGVREMVGGIPSRRYPEILSFVKEIPIRPGFEELLDYLEARGIPFIVLSGGLRGMVEARLGPLKARIHRIIAADVDLSGESIRVVSEYESRTELVAKPAVMDRFAAEESIVIGDGITDFQMARHGRVRFARGTLARYLDQEGLDYYPWSDFHDVRAVLEKSI